MSAPAGKISVLRPREVGQGACPQCGGAGSVWAFKGDIYSLCSLRCRACGGTGYAQREELSPEYEQWLEQFREQPGYAVRGVANFSGYLHEADEVSGEVCQRRIKLEPQSDSLSGTLGSWTAEFSPLLAP